MTKEDHEAPSNAELVEDDPNDPYEDHGQIITLSLLSNLMKRLTIEIQRGRK